ncbi:MAG: hypothetical protein ACK40K_09480 [Raineya sp.]
MSQQETPQEQPEKIEPKFAPQSWKEKLGYSAQILKIITAAAWRYSSRLVGVILIGTLVNIVFFIFLHNKIDHQLNQAGQATLIAVAMIVCFFVIFPFLYIIVAHKHALQSVVYFIANHFKTGVFEYFIEKAFAYAYKQPAIKAQLENNKVEDFFNITLPEYLEKLEGMNATLKRVFKRFTKNIDFLAIIKEAKETLGGEITLKNFEEYVSQKAAEQVPLPLLSKPNWAWVMAVMVFNILVFAAAFFFLSKRTNMKKSTYKKNKKPKHTAFFYL